MFTKSKTHLSKISKEHRFRNYHNHVMLKIKNQSFGSSIITWHLLPLYNAIVNLSFAANKQGTEFLNV